MNKKAMIVVSPHRAGLGGISKVVAIWCDEHFLDGVDVTYIATTRRDGKNKILALLQAIILYLAALPSADLMYVHCAARTSFYRKSIFIILAHVLRKKIILHIHPNEFKDFFDGLATSKHRYVLSVLCMVDSFVLLTEEMRKFISVIFPEKPSHVIRNAVNFRELEVGKPYKRAENKLIFMGWFVEEKGVYELVDAVERITGKGIEIHLDFFGTKEVDRLSKYVDGKGLAGEISVNGWVSGEEKLRALYTSTALVLPSHTEGIPNVILEAMATRTPIIATSVGGLKEVLRDGDNALIVAVRDPADLGNKIIRLILDESLRERLAEQAYLDARKQYDVAVVRTQVASLIASVLA